MFDAKILGVHRMTIWNRMRKYGILLTRNIDQSRNAYDLQTESAPLIASNQCGEVRGG
jgi:hypothetical protein